MGTRIDIPAHERGVIRVFALSGSDTRIASMQSDARAPHALLGTQDLDTQYCEIITIADLEGPGLAGYLETGCGVPAHDLVPDAHKLAALRGWVLIVYSRAFGGQAITLSPAPVARLIGTYEEGGPDFHSPDPLQAASAAPYTAPYTAPALPPRRPSDAAIGGRVASAVLILLALFTYIFIRIAG